MDTTWREERHPGAESHGEGKQGQGNPALAQWMQGQGSSREGDGAEKDDLIPNEVLARGKRPAWYDRLTLFPAALVLLTMARVGFAIFNIVHDCDEVTFSQAYQACRIRIGAAQDRGPACQCRRSLTTGSRCTSWRTAAGSRHGSTIRRSR